MSTLKLFIASLILPFIPPTKAFALKRQLYRWCGAKVGKDVRIVSSARILGNGELSIGDDTWIGHNVTIVCSSKIAIGKNCDIAPNVFIGNGTHEITPEKSRIAGADCSKNINIGDGCWLCAGSYILPGVSIGKMNVIAAGAVVTETIPNSYMLFGGIPARKLKNLR